MSNLIKVLVEDRREGKTTELIKWLLQGHRQEGYPQWSRVIVCVSGGMCAYTSRMIDRYLTEELLCAKSEPHLGEVCKDVHNHTFAQIRKAVWSMSDFEHNVRGREFEYAIDDLELFIERKFGGKMPKVVTMTGESVDSICD